MRVRAFDLVAAGALAFVGSMLGCSGSSLTGDDDGETTFGGSGNGGSTQGGVSGSLTAGGTINVPRGGGPPAGAGGVSTGGLFGECEDSDFSGTDPYTMQKTRGTTTGTNGTFEDLCDENGNLVEQMCEIRCAAGALPGTGGTAPGSYPRIVCGSQQATGRVVERMIDCGGRCTEGSCYHWCPTPGDSLTVVAVDGAEVRLRSVSDNEYRCTEFTSASSLGCAAAVDRELVVARTSACTLVRVLVGMDDPDTGPGEDCVYECTWSDG